MTRWSKLSIALSLIAVFAVGGCSKNDPASEEVSTKAKIDNNSPEAQNGKGAPPITDAPPPGVTKEPSGK